MANTKYAYVRNFELPDPLLPGTFLLLRLDGQSFHRFSETHSFTKPNDVRALKLMDRAARELMDLFPDIVLAFGESDEYSFLLKKSTTLFNRRQAKILSTLVSAFTGFYMFYWGVYFGGRRKGGEGEGKGEEEEGEEEVKMQYPASFDGRIVVYPSEKEVKDYFRWRQADTHINNLYNTVFWALVKSGKTTTEAHAVLKGTYSKDKHEILFTQFGINYNNIDARFRKGSILVREVIPEEEEEEIEHTQNDSTSSSQGPVQPSPSQPPSSPPTEPPPASQNPSALQHPASTSTDTPTPTPTSTSNTPVPTSTSTNTTTSMNTDTPSSTSPSTHPKSKKRPKKPKQPKTRVVLLHCDLIRDEFWDSRPGLLVD